jgi:predicted MFS family arabinose efflux permease
MIEWLQNSALFFAAYMGLFIAFYLAVNGLAALFETFWHAKWSDRRKAAIIVVTALSAPIAVLATWGDWGFMFALAMLPLANWSFAHDEREFRD